ncbi:RIKEN cDNA B630019A10, partial [Mus musculus]
QYRRCSMFWSPATWNSHSRYAGRQDPVTKVKTAGHLPSTGLRIRLLEKSGGNILLKKQSGSLTISDYPQTTSERLKTFLCKRTGSHHLAAPSVLSILEKRFDYSEAVITSQISTSELGEESNRAPRTQKIAGLGFLCSKIASTVRLLEPGPERSLQVQIAASHHQPGKEKIAASSPAPVFQIVFLHPLILSP